MPAKTEPKSGLKWGWDFGENGWNTGMDANMLSLGRFAYHLTIKDRDLTTPPGSPANGDTYIVATGATGAWLGKEDSVMVYDSTSASWAEGIPSVGWIAYIEDEEVLSAFKSTGWSAGLAI